MQKKTPRAWAFKKIEKPRWMSDHRGFRYFAKLDRRWRSQGCLITTLVLVPSLQLVRETLHEWLKETAWERPGPRGRSYVSSIQTDPRRSGCAVRCPISPPLAHTVALEFVAWMPIARKPRLRCVAASAA